MPSQRFIFKQFAIEQDHCAMKVGTDGVLLGAWAGQHTTPQNILDVGTGTGLIALMMAQRFTDASIHAIEIEPNAAVQAEQNFRNAPFLNSPQIYHSDFFDWNTHEKFDLIVCNPPFYSHAFPAATSEREIARHGKRFNIMNFMQRASQLLSDCGHLSIIIPTSTGIELIHNRSQLHLGRQCKVMPKTGKDAHRLMLEWSKSKTLMSSSHLTIEKMSRHEYSAEYINLTKDFYLHF